MYGYSPVGDLTVISICFVMIVLICFSFVRNNRSFRIFLGILAVLILTASADVIFHSLAERGTQSAFLAAYWMRCLYHTMLSTIFFLFAAYICEVTRLDRKQKTVFLSIAGLILLGGLVAELVTTAIGAQGPLTAEKILSQGRNVFIIGYASFVILMVVMLLIVRNRIYIKIMRGFYGAIALSFIIILIEALLKDSSYTVATFLYPTLAMFYSMHSNPYNATLGSSDIWAFSDFVKQNHEAGREFFYFSLFLRPYSEEGVQIPLDLQASIRRHGSTNFKSALLFNVEKGHVVMAAIRSRNKDYESRMKRALEEFQEEYEQFGVDFKVVIGESIPEISEKNEYVSFIREIRENMEDNTVHFVDQTDIERFRRSEYIRNALEDIYQGKDIDDPRVLTYCQPVFNIKTQKYDTAEALMRLELDGEIFYPDQFIPVAEDNGYIHMLTEIILHKTCMEIKRLLEEGYNISRISVNVSALELKDEAFCDDISRIIQDTRIPGDKIAIELTESQTESDFYVMKKKIDLLKAKGIKFYLDDFGTGYSNMERIMELPFDIIKFDRSLVIACETNERSRKIVLGLANIFSAMNYSVLYEGVEREAEEEMCKNMSASYLQGYKYSRPIPIGELRQYIERIRME